MTKTAHLFAALASFPPANPPILRTKTMTKLASLAAALILFAPLAIATLMQAAQIVA